MSSVSSTIHLPFFHDSIASQCPRTTSSLSMDCDFLNSKKKKETSQLLTLKPPLSKQETVTFCHLNFGRKQPSPEELYLHESLEFKNFIARETFLNEEYWISFFYFYFFLSFLLIFSIFAYQKTCYLLLLTQIAAALRTEHSWENKSGFNHYEKRIDTIEEYDKIKKQCREPQPGHSSTCIIAVKKHVKSVSRIVLLSVVGTLDLNIRCLHLGEGVYAPGFQVKGTSSSRHGYVANLVVAKSYRRKRIASNMLSFAMKYAKSRGVNSFYAHVNRHDGPALALFQKLGFEVLEIANPLMILSNLYLLGLQM
ncbi:uncharacterized protein LOC108336741 [Vigna angularis]|uniref:uncharacterized protein LOC108336741 n=1 Tax=Phaseolus angularis TaxID=3914 RepID=UPI0022B4CBB0|nr:uncharacterized protein LOC108336741 [Vigna angularis]